MTRKRCKRASRPARCPAMVALHLAPEVGIGERVAVDAIAGGWAETYHFNVLADCRDLLAIAARRRNAEQTYAVCELAFVALANIKDRYLAKHRLGATGDELQALRVLVDVSEDFWMRQSGELFRVANEALDRERSRGRRAAG